MRVGCRGWICTSDLLGMNQMSYYFSTLHRQKNPPRLR